MKDSLLNLQRGIGLREYSSEAEEKRSPYHWHPTRRPRGHAVQYETCFLWSRMQAAARHTVREREREQTEGEAGPTVSWSNRHRERNSRLQRTEVKTPRRRKSWTRSAPTTHSNWGVPNITEALWEGARLAPFLPVKTPFPSSLLFPSASYCKPCWPGRARETDRKLLHAFRQPRFPQSVLMWSSSSVCVSNKRRTEDKKRSSQRKGRGSFQVFKAFYALSTVPNQSSPRGPRCSVPSLNLHVIRVQYGPTAKKDEKCCRWSVLVRTWSQSGLVPCPTVK